MSKKDQVYQPKVRVFLFNKSKASIRSKNVAKDAHILLDQWNEKHIELLKMKFQESIAKERKGKMQGLDKAAFIKVFADLKTFPKVKLVSLKSSVASG